MWHPLLVASYQPTQTPLPAPIDLDPEEVLEFELALLVPTAAASSPDEALIPLTLSPPDSHHKFQELLQRVVLNLGILLEEVQLLNVLQPRGLMCITLLLTTPFCNSHTWCGTHWRPAPLRSRGRNAGTSCWLGG